LYRIVRFVNYSVAADQWYKEAQNWSMDWTPCNSRYSNWDRIKQLRHT